MSVENEYKFTSERTDASACLQALESFMDNSGISYSISVKNNTDLYYDSDGMEITAEGCLIRKRTSADGRCKLTAKRPISADGMVSREEIETASDGSFEGLQAFCDECFPGIRLNDSPMLTNECERTAFVFENPLPTKITFDKCRYVDGHRRKDYLEIEIEVVSDTTISDFDHIGAIDFITRVLKFVPVSKSKYERGLEWKKQNPEQLPSSE